MYFCEEWLETEWMRTQYRRTTFNPDPNFKCPDDVYNFWEGYVEPKKSSHSQKNGKGNRFSHNNDSSVERRVFKKNKEEA